MSIITLQRHEYLNFRRVLGFRRSSWHVCLSAVQQHSSRCTSYYPSHIQLLYLLFSRLQSRQTFSCKDESEADSNEDAGECTNGQHRREAPRRQRTYPSISSSSTLTRCPRLINSTQIKVHNITPDCSTWVLDMDFCLKHRTKRHSKLKDISSSWYCNETDTCVHIWCKLGLVPCILYIAMKT